jgi:hypothetical protein
MARDHDRKRVAGVRAADRPRAAGQTQSARLVRVRSGLAVRDLQQRKPGPKLEVRPCRIEWKVELPPSPGEVLGELPLCFLDERFRADRLSVAPFEPLQPVLGRNDPKRADGRQRSAPSSCKSCTFRSSPPA